MAYYKKQQLKSNSKWYPKAAIIGKPVSTKEVAQRLAALSSLSTGDVNSVLDLLGGVLGDFMNEGRTVKLNGFGTFYYTIDSSGNGVDTPQEVSAQQIKGTRVRFIPETTRNSNNQVTSRSLVSSNVFWQLLDEDLPDGAVDGSQTGGGSDENEGQTEDPLA